MDVNKPRMIPAMTIILPCEICGAKANTITMGFNPMLRICGACLSKAQEALRQAGVEDKPLEMNYEGKIYIRPVHRGITLDEKDLEMMLCELLGDAYSVSSGWGGRAKIKITLEER